MEEGGELREVIIRSGERKEKERMVGFNEARTVCRRTVAAVFIFLILMYS